jgi:regulator of sigma E protease
MVVLLGLLIFIHELGHFLVAKHYKVRVETFSLGFGPKLLKYKRGDTVYALSAIPLGGYVKMFGDEPGSEVQADQRHAAFTHKPVLHRIAIVLAGPIMNFLFAIVLFMGVALVGEQVVAPKLGDIPQSVPAFAAGFRSGDQIVGVDGHPAQSWDGVQRAIEASGDRRMTFDVRREGQPASSQVVAIAVEPKVVTNKNILSWDEKVGEIEGLSYSSRASAIGVSDPKSPAGLAGLRTGDVISAVNGAKIDKWRELEVAAREQGAASGKLMLSVARGSLQDRPGDKEETKAFELAIPAGGRGLEGSALLATLGIESPEMFLAPVPEEKSFLTTLGLKKPQKTPAATAGLREGDKILAVNGAKAASFEEIAKMIRAYSGDGPLTLAYVRDGEVRRADVVPNMRLRMSPQGREEKRYEIGIRPLIVDAPVAMTEIAVANPVAALARGFSQTMKWTSLTALSFVRLFQNEVSAKNIGGFLSIGQMAKKSWQMGPAQFLNIMGIISINLFLLNLLPVPVLDGGHLVFYLIELLRGAPMSMKKLEMAQQVGLVLLLGLMAFALFNDVSRLFGG